MAVNLRFNRDNSTLSANGVENGSARVLRRIPLTERLISLSRTITNRTPAYFEPGNSKKKKKTSPSKRLRDIRRLISYRCRKACEMLSTATQTDSSGPTDGTQCSEISSTTEAETTSTMQSPAPVRNTVDPSRIYQDFELTLQLSRMEETPTLTTALRHIIRKKHEKGKNITFPTIEAVDRIQLRSQNLPTDPDNLLQLTTKVFERRGESFDLEDIYQQFVVAHGRIALNAREKWPDSHIHTHHP